MPEDGIAHACVSGGCTSPVVAGAPARVVMSRMDEGGVTSAGANRWDDDTSWRAAGGWRRAAGGWRLAASGGRLAAGGGRLAVGRRRWAKGLGCRPEPLISLLRLDVGQLYRLGACNPEFWIAAGLGEFDGGSRRKLAGGCAGVADLDSPGPRISGDGACNRGGKERGATPYWAALSARSIRSSSPRARRYPCSRGGPCP